MISNNKCLNKELNNNIIKTSFNDVLKRPLNICFIGAGYVGGTSSAVMAYKCPEKEVMVTVCDVDNEKIKAWKSDNVNYIFFL